MAKINGFKHVKFCNNICILFSYTYVSENEINIILGQKLLAVEENESLQHHNSTEEILETCEEIEKQKPICLFF